MYIQNINPLLAVDGTEIIDSSLHCTPLVRCNPLYIHTSALDIMHIIPITPPGRVTDTAGTGPSRAAVALAETVKVWRGISSHRLMGSMPPLPFAASRTSRPQIPSDNSASVQSATEQSAPSALMDLELSSLSPAASALCTYR